MSLEREWESRERTEAEEEVEVEVRNGLYVRGGIVRRVGWAGRGYEGSRSRRGDPPAQSKERYRDRAHSQLWARARPGKPGAGGAALRRDRRPRRA